MGAHTSLLTLCVTIFMTCPFGIATAATIRVGNLLGAGLPQAAKRTGLSLEKIIRIRVRVRVRVRVRLCIYKYWVWESARRGSSAGRQAHRCVLFKRKAFDGLGFLLDNIGYLEVRAGLSQAAKRTGVPLNRTDLGFRVSLGQYKVFGIWSSL